MRAMVLTRLAALADNPEPLSLRQVDHPEPAAGEVLIEISACGVCHTELDEIEGRTPPPRLPVVPGHEVVGRVARPGAGVSGHRVGDRVGVGWIHHSSGAADENLDPAFRATGRDVDGGYAEYMTVPADYAHPLPDGLTDLEAAPLLCAGAVGYRALRLTGLRNGEILGLTGFGGSAHLVLQLARHLYPESPVQVFARHEETREFARQLGAAWSGAGAETPPEPPHAIIDTTPAWRPVLNALGALRPGGRLVINAIRKEAGDRHVMAEVDYARHLWMEKEIKTVANVTGPDIAAFLRHAAEAGIRPTVQAYALEDANAALRDLKNGRIRGAKVLDISA